MTDFSLEFSIAAFVFGLCIGSFLNVCIYRLPARKSLVHPGSTCPSCGQPIRFYDNIPVISYLLILGRCRHCKASISPRYPLVEVLGGLLALGTFMKFGPSLQMLVFFGFMATLLVVTFIDLDHQIIPNVITLPGIPLMLLAGLAVPGVSLQEALLGLVVGGGSLYLVAWGYHAFTGKEGMGGGDIKLLAMIGALIGWKGVLFTIFISSAIGSMAGILVMLATRGSMKLKIPFGPFLSIGAILYVFLGQEIIHWYFNMLV